MADAAQHGYLWTLLDGTPAHSPIGELAHDLEGRLACHLCGRWFAHLGGHLRSHGWTAARYREAVGLPLHIALCSDGHSASIAGRQARRWVTDSSLQKGLAIGQQAARNGELSKRAAHITQQREAAGHLPQTMVAARSLRLAEGRETTRRRRQAELRDVVSAAGADDLAHLLRSAYTDGATLTTLTRLTGLGREQLRHEMDRAGIEVRPPGQNRLVSKRDRARRIDAAVAEQVGTDNIQTWLFEQHQQGTPVADLAARTGRSIPWVRSRIRGTTTTSSARAHAR